MKGEILWKKAIAQEEARITRLTRRPSCQPRPRPPAHRPPPPTHPPAHRRAGSDRDRIPAAITSDSSQDQSRCQAAIVPASPLATRPSPTAAHPPTAGTVAFHRASSRARHTPYHRPSAHRRRPPAAWRHPYYRPEGEPVGDSVRNPTSIATYWTLATGRDRARFRRDRGRIPARSRTESGAITSSRDRVRNPATIALESGRDLVQSAASSRHDRIQSARSRPVGSVQSAVSSRERPVGSVQSEIRHDRVQSAR
ncbi:atherin-like [Zingiber officinale]|uniref:atherin-like n=1 Tax=Zingiber officinale TaxID=94328 RepID=UPI001C4AE8A7|nr:atherin-like [Zingiber officinale]